MQTRYVRESSRNWSIAIWMGSRNRIEKDYFDIKITLSRKRFTYSNNTTIAQIKRHLATCNISFWNCDYSLRNNKIWIILEVLKLLHVIFNLYNCCVLWFITYFSNFSLFVFFLLSYFVLYLFYYKLTFTYIYSKKRKQVYYIAG